MAISKIGSKALVDCSVAAVDIEDNSITSAKLAGSIANAKLANSSITVNGTSVSLGASGSIPAVSWQSVVTADGSTATSAVAGNGYFIDTTSAAHTINLPGSPSAGDTIAIKDYAGTFGTNNLTIGRNGNNIQGVAGNSSISTNRASLILVYSDATKGWLYTVESNVADLVPAFVAATGGTVTTSGDFKIHTFTGDGCFVVSCGGNPSGSTSVSYMVVAGGGGANGGGGGAGGFREGLGSNDSYTGSPLRSPTGVPVSVTTYPVTVGGGGTSPGGASSDASKGTNGSNSVFSTITSAGGGAGGSAGSNPCTPGNPGGSGGGAGRAPSPGCFTVGSGNTPPTSPPQGNNGGLGASGGWVSGGGGGATAVAANPSPGAGGDQPGGGDVGGLGGAGAGTGINPSCTVGTPGPNGALRYFAGGGGGQDYQNPSPQGGTMEGTPVNGGGGVGGGGNAQVSGLGNEGNGNGSATAGSANTGGGGGGGAYNSGQPAASYGKAGGSGIVIIRYKYQ